MAIKEQHGGDLCGDELVLCLDYGGGYTNLRMWLNGINYTDTSMSISDHSIIVCKVWPMNHQCHQLSEEGIGPPCTIFTTVSESLFQNE